MLTKHALSTYHRHGTSKTLWALGFLMGLQVVNINSCGLIFNHINKPYTGPPSSRDKLILIDPAKQNKQIK
jgi:hypothetical protein